VAETIVPESPATPAPKGLIARAIGIPTSPRATYAGVAARPRWIGIYLLSVVIAGGASGAFMSTQVGRRAIVDQQVTAVESFGRHPTQQQLDIYEKMAPYYMYIAPATQAISSIIGTLVLSGILIAIFNALMGGNATFKQVLSVVAHSGIVLAAQALFVFPLDYVRETMTSPTNFAVFLPMLDEASFLARMLGAIDLFVIWWVVNLAIGIGVLYKRRTGPIATGLLVVYAAIAIVVAAVKSAFSGA